MKSELASTYGLSLLLWYISEIKLCYRMYSSHRMKNAGRKLSTVWSILTVIWAYGKSTCAASHALLAINQLTKFSKYISFPSMEQSYKHNVDGVTYHSREVLRFLCTCSGDLYLWLDEVPIFILVSQVKSLESVNRRQIIIVGRHHQKQRKRSSASILPAPSKARCGFYECSFSSLWIFSVPLVPILLNCSIRYLFLFIRVIRTLHRMKGFSRYEH